MSVSMSSSLLSRVYLVLLLSLVWVACGVCSDVVGDADVLAGEVLYGGGEDSGGGRVAALLSPALAACVVKAQPGLVRFIRDHAAYYPALRVVYTGDTPRLQVFYSSRHMRDNVVDSQLETDEQLIDRLQHPDSTHTHHSSTTGRPSLSAATHSLTHSLCTSVAVRIGCRDLRTSAASPRSLTAAHRV